MLREAALESEHSYSEIHHCTWNSGVFRTGNGVVNEESWWFQRFNNE